MRILRITLAFCIGYSGATTTYMGIMTEDYFKIIIGILSIVLWLIYIFKQTYE